MLPNCPTLAMGQPCYCTGRCQQPPCGLLGKPLLPQPKNSRLIDILGKIIAGSSAPTTPSLTGNPTLFGGYEWDGVSKSFALYVQVSIPSDRIELKVIDPNGTVLSGQTYSGDVQTGTTPMPGSGIVDSVRHNQLWWFDKNDRGAAGITVGTVRLELTNVRTGQQAIRTINLPNGDSGYVILYSGAWDNVPPPMPSLLPPTGLSIANSTQATLTASWTAATNATGYQVQRSLVPFTGSPTDGIDSTTATTLLIGALSVQTTYYLRVRSTRGNSVSDWSPSITATTLAAGQLPAFTGLTAQALSASSIRLLWPVVNGASGYTIQRSLNGSTNWLSMPDDSGDITTPVSFTDIGLSPATTYYYRVKAVGAGVDLTTWGTVSIATPTAVGVFQIVGPSVTADLDVAGETPQFQIVGQAVTADIDLAT